MGWSLVHIQRGRGLQDESDQTFRPYTFPLAAESSFQVAGPAATDRDCARARLPACVERCIALQPNGLTIEVHPARHTCRRMPTADHERDSTASASRPRGTSTHQH
jgi:hypothetical protein